jgi:hypothetical protein
MKPAFLTRNILPQLDGKALDFAKICAALCMVIDHINYILLHESNVLMILIGRTTFPIFCYSVAIALQKSEGKRIGDYAVKLIILAVLTQPFYQFVFDRTIANVIFTLAAGGVFATLVYRLKPLHLYGLFVFAMAAQLLPASLEFSTAGIMLPAAFLMALRREKYAGIFLVTLLFFVNIENIIEYHDSGVWISMLMLGAATSIFPFVVLNIAQDFAQTGRYLHKYALHMFYPTHIMILKIIALLFFK